METISTALTAQLQTHRVMFNKRFALTKRAFPDLNPDEFREFLIQILDPLVVVAERIDPGVLPAFVDTAFTVGIQLIGKKIIGPKARSTTMEKLWKTTFPSIIKLILNDPGPILTKLSNAAYQIDVDTHARCDEWLSYISVLGPQCNDCTTLLSLVQVCAWKCGMAHYRHGAISLLPTIPEPLCRALFRVVDNSDLTTITERLNTDPWYDPGKPDQHSPQPFRYCTGGFLGLGGPFIHPPLVTAYQDKLLLWCDKEWWIIHADVFGVTCKRLLSIHTNNIPDIVQTEAKKVQSGNSSITDLVIDGGKVTFRNHTYDLSHEGQVRDVAVASNTLIITLKDSHLVWIFEVKRS